MIHDKYDVYTLLCQKQMCSKLKYIGIARFDLGIQVLSWVLNHRYIVYLRRIINIFIQNKIYINDIDEFTL